MIATLWIDMFDMHGLSGIVFAGLAVFTAAICAFVNPAFSGTPGQFTHEQLNLEG
jgi:hypothetical protein